MSELRPSAPIRRPSTARPRRAAEETHDHAEPAIVVAPPDAPELEAMQRHLARLPVHSGATVTHDATLGVMLTHHPDAGPAGGAAAMPRWTEERWQASLEAVAERQRRTGAWPSIVVSALDRPPDLGERLRALGWHAVQRETVLWVGRASVIAHLDPRLRIEAVQARSVDVHEALEREVFGLPPETAPARRQALRDALTAGGLRAFVVRVDDEPVAVARLSQGEGVAGLYAIGVRVGWRGQGYGTLITTVATRAGMAIGNRLVWLSVEDANEVARHVYGKLHFQEAFAWTRWLAGPG